MVTAFFSLVIMCYKWSLPFLSPVMNLKVEDVITMSSKCKVDIVKPFGRKCLIDQLLFSICCASNVIATIFGGTIAFSLFCLKNIWPRCYCQIFFFTFSFHTYCLTCVFGTVCFSVNVKNQARKLNNQETCAEEERKRRPANWEAKRKISEWEEEQDQLKMV